MPRNDLEHQHQVALFNWAATVKKKYPKLAMMYAVPNAGKRTPRQGAYMKAEGLRSGVPDICLPVAMHGFHGLYIELKVEGRKPSESQKGWIEALREEGYRVEVCNEWPAAKALIERYLNA